MKKLFLILLFIVIASLNLHAANKPPRCGSVFDSREIRMAEQAILEFIAPIEVKKRLLKQSVYYPEMREFLIEFSDLVSEMYLLRFTEALDGKFGPKYDKVGFKSADDARMMKEEIINKQILVLSTMNPQDLTTEFKKDFLQIIDRVFQPKIKREELLKISNRLDNVILFYSKI